MMSMEVSDQGGGVYIESLVKQLVENARKKKQVYLGFMDLEKAYL